MAYEYTLTDKNPLKLLVEISSVISKKFELTYIGQNGLLVIVDELDTTEKTALDNVINLHTNTFYLIKNRKQNIKADGIDTEHLIACYPYQQGVVDIMINGIKQSEANFDAIGIVKYDFKTATPGTYEIQFKQGTLISNIVTVVAE
ncbi:MAG: hypothetical protein AB1349_01710 [Elusimicrobiota bacterium]